MSSFKEKLRRGVVQAQKMVDHVAKYSSIINSMGNNPGMHNYVGAGVGLTGVMLEHLRTKLFDDGELVSFQFVRGAGYQEVYDLLRAHATLVGSVDNWSLFDLDGTNLYAQRQHRLLMCDKSSDPDAAKQALARLLWRVGHGFIALRVISEYNKEYAMAGEAPTKFFDSHYAQNVLAGIRRYREHGKNRSVLLCGSPGSGKTAMAYRVAQQSQGHTLILECDGGLGVALVRSAVEDLAPRTIILNEIDKLSVYGSTILEILEYINDQVPLVLATANHKDRLAPPLLRPGRFDEILDVEQVDDLMYQNLVNFPCTDEVATALHTWPVAFVSELRNRMDVEADRFDHHFKDLSERLAFIIEKSKPKSKD